jgi:hypothetical protein
MTTTKNIIATPLRLIGSYPVAFVLIATLAGLVGLAALSARGWPEPRSSAEVAP